MKSILILLSSAVVTHAAIINVDTYSYLGTGGASPHATYPDSSGAELTDGVTDTPVWPNPAVIAPLVGFLNDDPSITFNFSGSETVRTVSIWFADSDGSAGVALPTDVNIRTLDSSFSQDFNVTNPAGSGSMVRFDFTGFEVTTDNLVVSSTRGNQWTMITEVRFDTESIPEPSSVSLLALASLCFLRRRR